MRIHLSPPHMSGKEQKYIQEAFEQNWIAPAGPNIEQFEQGLAKYVGVTDSVATSSGTAAIHLALKVLQIKRGDYIFCSSFTFIASANPIVYEGGIPVFIDSEEETWNMCPIALEIALRDAAKHNTLPKAVIVVHLFGQSAKMNEIMQLCEKYDVPVIEDAAESLGAIYKGKQSGTMGRFGVYSFNGNKIITTSGGGMLVSNDEVAIKRAQFYATQAREPVAHYEHQVIGYNYRLSNVLAGIGRGQLEVLDLRIQQKRKIFQYYKEQLAMIEGISFQDELKDTVSNRWLSTIRIDQEVHKITPDEMIQCLNDEQIEARRVWKPLHTQLAFQDATFYCNQKSVCETIFSDAICLPSGTNMTDEEQDRVIAVIKKAITKIVVS